VVGIGQFFIGFEYNENDKGRREKRDNGGRCWYTDSPIGVLVKEGSLNKTDYDTSEL